MKHCEQNRIGQAGVVRYQWRDCGGLALPLETARNTLCYGFADAAAHVLAGDAAWVPSHIGYIFGTVAAPTGFDTISREQTWSSLRTEIADITTGNIQLSALALTPTIKLAPAEGAAYSGNAVVYSATSESDDASVLGFTGAAYKTTGLEVGDYLYGAVLFAKPKTEYIPVARVSFYRDGAYPQKSDNKELALFWQVSIF